MKRIIFIICIVIALFSSVKAIEVDALHLATYEEINNGQKCGIGEVLGACRKVDSVLHHAVCSNTATYPIYKCDCVKPPPEETPVPTQTPPPPPVCSGDCSVYQQCPLECPVCVKNGSQSEPVNSANPNGTCRSLPPPPTRTATPTKPISATPTRTPTPTTPPGVCNDTCDDASDCALGGDGCTACVPNGNGGKTCQVPPSVTPTPRIPACNTPCENPSACLGAQDGCTYCNPVTDTCQAQPTSTPVPTSSPAPTSSPRPTSSPVPTKRPPTPTPDFNESMCKCDYLTITALASGRPFTAVGKGKVMGLDTTKAVISGIRFRLYEGSLKLAETAYLPATVTNSSSTLVNYSATWKSTMPSTIKKNVDYRIQAVLRCAPKATAMGGASAVMGESTSSNAFFAGITAFVKDLAFRIQSLPMRSSQIASEDTLQLQTFTPMQITENSCSFIKFRVK